jgi:hypothetical protein
MAENQTGQDGRASKSDWYFHGLAGSSKSDIWQWWRERRFRYNRDLFFAGVGTWLLVMFAGSAAVKPGVDFEEPLMMVIGPFFYAIFANLAYTAGPLLDTIVYRGTPRKRFLKAGMCSRLCLPPCPVSGLLLHGSGRSPLVRSWIDRATCPKTGPLQQA